MCFLYKANSATARITQATIPTPKPAVKPWMGKRNPVKLVSAVVKRKSPVVTGNLFEANIPPTTISPLPIATRVIMTCKIVKAPTDIPRIIGKSPLLACSFAEVRFRKGGRHAETHVRLCAWQHDGNCRSDHDCSSIRSMPHKGLRLD